MAEKNNASCSICGKEYYMCLACKEHKILYPWKIHTDTSEHYKIYQIIHGYSTGVYDKSEAKSKLQAVDLSDLNSFKNNIKRVIKDIMSDNNVVSEKVDCKSEEKEITQAGESVEPNRDKNKFYKKR